MLARLGSGTYGKNSGIQFPKTVGCSAPAVPFSNVLTIPAKIACRIARSGEAPIRGLRVDPPRWGADFPATLRVDPGDPRGGRGLGNDSKAAMRDAQPGS